MGQVAFPFGPDDPELTLEPVTGWRMWRLERSPSGRIRLCSPMQPLVWPPREAVRAACGLHTRAHGVPGERCGCGVYAAASIERLRVSGVPFGSTGVLGTVSMWGRVVEHVAGYRAEHAYPGRIRLVCPRCVARARLSRIEHVVRVGDALIPTCRRHAAGLGGEPVPQTPAELEAELLSEYAVDVLPFEPLRDALARARVPEAVQTFTKQVRTEARAFVGSWTGRLGAAVMVVLFLWLGVREHDVPVSVSEAVPSPRETISPLPGTGDPVRFPLTAPDTRGRDVFPLEFVCGRLEGDIVELVLRCRRQHDLLGAAVIPPAPRRACTSDGYTRKGAFSVCWLSPVGPLDRYPHPAIWRMPGVTFDDVFRPPSGSDATGPVSPRSPSR